MASDFTLKDCCVKPHAQPCWDCAKACGGCTWSEKLEPVPGWVAKKRVRYHKANGQMLEDVSYAIKYCPEFEPEVPDDQE